MTTAARFADEDVDSDSWCTARELANLLGHFSTDPCSNPRSWIDADAHYMLEMGVDGLLRAWGYSAFVNGPYSDPLPWCLRLAKHDGPWCSLWKLDPTTRWFSTLIESRATWAAFRKRLKFERPDKKPITANFPSVLVYRDWTPCAELSALLWTPNNG
jgi:hypothetical protein